MLNIAKKYFVSFFLLRMLVILSVKLGANSGQWKTRSDADSAENTRSHLFLSYAVIVYCDLWLHGF